MGGYKYAEKLPIYSLYDKEENLVFTGNMDEITKFIPCNKQGVYHSTCKGSFIKHKYKAVKVGFEPIKEKRCYRCGKMIPVNKLVHYHRPSDGKWVPRTICKTCRSEESIESDKRRNDACISIFYVYDGDELIFKGNYKEVADFVGVSTNMVYNYVYRGNKIFGRYTIIRKYEKIKGE